jgi:tetratricopeptide (TPR) repeat protein
MTRLLLTALLASLVFTGIASAQSHDSDNDAKSQKSKKTLTDSAALFQAGDFDKAEKAVQANNRSDPKSAEWYLETARTFIRMAFQYQSKGDELLAAAASEIAQDNLEKAKKKVNSATPPAVVAAINENLGMVYERLIGDTAKAADSYQAADEAFPDSKSARKKLDKLNKAKDETTKRQTKNTKG